MSRLEAYALLASNALILLAVVWNTLQVRRARLAQGIPVPEGLMLRPAADISAERLAAAAENALAAVAPMPAVTSKATADQALEFLTNPLLRDARVRAAIRNLLVEQENIDMATIKEKLADALAKLNVQGDRLSQVEAIDGAQDQKIAALTTQVNELLAGAADPADVDAINAKIAENGARLDALAQKQV